jgi:two-component system, sensor histidine kinase PdtaS
LAFPNRAEAALILFLPAALFCSLFLSQASGLIALICATFLVSSAYSSKLLDR